MANFNLTPNMNLPNPVPSTDPGPDYADNLESSLDIVDAHDHSAGSGVQITPAGINISTDLPFQSNNATQLRSSRYNNAGTPLALGTDLCCVYFSGGDFYINNSSGTAVQITSGSSVNAGAGSITGLPSGTASVTFSASKYIFNSATSTRATIDVGSVILRATTASSNGLTLSPPSLTGGNINQVLPPVPGSTSFMTMDSSGNMGTSISTNQGITRAMQAAVNPQIGSTCGNFSTTSTTPVTVTNMDVDITTSGRPVIVAIQSDGLGGVANIGVESSANINAVGFIEIYRDGSLLVQEKIEWATGAGLSGGAAIYVPSSSIRFMDTVSGGTHEYVIKAYVSGSGMTLYVNNAVLALYEL